MAKSRKKKPSADGDPGAADAPAAPTPSLEDDAAALAGWWVQGRVSRLLCVWEYSLTVYHPGADFGWRGWIDFDLEDRGGARLLVELQGTDLEFKTPVFEYRLTGDWLELKDLPEAASRLREPNPQVWKLAGRWFRLRFPEGA